MLNLEQTMFVIAGRVSTCYVSCSANAIRKCDNLVFLQMELACVDLWTPFGSDLHFREGPKHCLGPRAYNELITEVKGMEGHKATMLGEGKPMCLSFTVYILQQMPNTFVSQVRFANAIRKCDSLYILTRCVSCR
jgi:hypothetical protein